MKHDHNPKPVIDYTAQDNSKIRPTTVDNSKQADKTPDYESNPFTISFDGFSLLIDYARGVLFVILFWGLFSFAGNAISTITDVANSSDTSTTQTSLEIENLLNAVDAINPTAIAAILVLVAVVFLLLLATGFAINAAFKGFAAAGAVAASDKRNISLGEAFREMTSRFGTLFFAEAITTARIIGGYILFIVPGIRAQLRYSPTATLIMREKELTANQAVTRSKELYSGHLMEVFGILTVGGIIPIIGQSLSISGLALSVKQITEYAKAKRQSPKTHWLNYLGFILFFLLVLFIVFIVAVLAYANK